MLHIHNSFNNQLTFFQKIRNFDYILLICILLLGVISSFSMYSTDGGNILFHSKSHISKFLIFFFLMIIFSFFSNISRLSGISSTDWFISFNLGFFIWYQSFRLSKMDKFIFY